MKKFLVLCLLVAFVALPTTTNAATAHSRWMGFLNRTISYNTNSLEHLQSFIDDLKDYSVYSASWDAQDIRNESLTYIRWLNVHLPTSCYKSMWTSAKATATNLAVAMKYWKSWLEDYPYGSNYEYNTGMSYMKKAMSGINSLNRIVKSVHC